MEGEGLFNDMSKYCRNAYIDGLSKRLDPIQSELLTGIIDGLLAYFKMLIGSHPQD
jgi:hypothetical protein